MSMQKVGWEYINGVTALNNLMNMIEAAIKAADIKFYPGYPRAAGWDFKGFWMEDKRFWSGIHYNNPLVVTFELTDKSKYNKDLLNESIYELREGRERLWFRLDLEKCHFFSCDRDEQLEELTKFINTAYTDAQKMKIDRE